MTTTPALLGRRTVLGVLAAVGGLMAANSLLFGTQLMFDSAPYSEVARSAPHFPYHGILLGLLVALSLIVPHLAVLAGPQGRGFPRAVLMLLGAGILLDAATRFVEAFVVPFLATNAPELLDNTPDAMLMSAMVGAWLVYLAGLVALGVVAYRRRIFSRPAAALLVLGGLSIPAIGPLSGMLVGGGLVWAGSAGLRRGEAASEHPVATVPVG